MLETILRAANLAVAYTTCSHIALVIAERSGCGRKAITSVTAPCACVTPDLVSFLSLPHIIPARHVRKHTPENSDSSFR